MNLISKNMKEKEILHEGRIIEITPEFTSVEIISSSACSQCHAKGLCGFSEEKSKVVMVPTSPYREHAVGDSVTLALKQTMGLKAVWISYVVPLIILMILILSLSSVIGSEIWTGLASIGGVALYYLVIWMMRDRLRNEFVFYIKD